MTMTDGWVGEQVSPDHTVVPVLYAPSPTAPTPQPGGRTSRSERRSERRQRVRPVTTVTSTLVRIATWTPLIAGAIVGALLAWPLVEDLFAADPEPAPLSASIDEPTQRIVVDGDDVYLEGSVPSQEISDAFELAAHGLLGDERVINNFRIEADAVFDPAQPVRLTVAETVQFPTGGADIGEQYAPLIDLAVEMLSARSQLSLTIIGHTDATGDEATNLALSLQRAQATAVAIESRGIDPVRLTTQGRGEAEPVASNDTPEGRQANRRVEFLVTGFLD